MASTCTDAVNRWRHSVSGNPAASGAGGGPGLGASRWHGLRGASPALKFVLMVGVMSFFADFTYEGSRSVVGPYLGTLGAGALAIAVISGLGEFLGYGLRLFSGRAADRSGRYWPITISGYVVQMAAVPLLALAGSWQVAALLIIAERVGKATRNPPRDAMLSHAARDMGYGWGFGVHEALDQFGALFGPLLVALVLAVSQHDYKLAFAALAVPALITLSLLLVERTFFQRLYDTAGIGVLIPLTAAGAAYAPLVFLGGTWAALAGVALWGLSMGVQESIIPAAVAPMVSPDRRASAYGLFTGVYGTAWVLGSVVIGALFSVSLGAVTAFAAAAQLGAIPFIVLTRRRVSTRPPAESPQAPA